LIAPAEHYLQWGVKHSERKITKADRVFPFGYRASAPTDTMISEAEQFWRERSINSARKDFVVCFFGTLGRQFDLETVIASARRLKTRRSNVRFVICGRGEMAKHYEEMASDCSNVVFPGWVNAPQIWTLMRMGAVGLAPYRKSVAFASHVPNKAIEYLSAGLPILSTIDGELGRLLRERVCGIVYPIGDSAMLADVITTLHDNSALREEMARNCKRLFHERFEAERVYGELAEYLERLETVYPGGHLDSDRAAIGMQESG